MSLITGVPVETSGRGGKGVAVYLQDQKTASLSLPFLNRLSIAELATDTVQESRVITLIAGHSVIVGNTVELTVVDTGYFMQAQVISVSVNTITIDSPINCVFTAGSDVLVSSRQMNVNGSITPQVFSINPLPSQIGDFTRVIFKLVDELEMDSSTFGGIDELINGCVLRVKLSDGCYRNIFNFKSNSDIVNECFDSNYTSANKRGEYGFASRLTWGGQNKHGVVIPTDGSLGEELQLVIQDDLTALSSFRMKAQGHVPQ